MANGHPVLVCGHCCCGRGRYLSVSKTHDDKRFRGSYAFKEVRAAPGPVQCVCQVLAPASPVETHCWGWLHMGCGLEGLSQGTVRM